MTKIEKLLSKLRNNPRDWQIGTNHVTFRHQNGAKLTVPAHRPIKPIYIKKFVRLIDEGEGE